MEGQKTKPTEASVQSFLDTVLDESVRDDCHELIKIMKKITGEGPRMWGRGIVVLESTITNMKVGTKVFGA